MRKTTVKVVDGKVLTTVAKVASEKSPEFKHLVALQKKLMGRSWKGATR